MPDEPDKPAKKSYIGQAWLVLVLALCFGAALAGIETALRPIIEQNKLRATIEQIPHLVCDLQTGEAADANASETVPPESITVGAGRTRTLYECFRALRADGRQIGWVVKAGGKGFAGRIELLIGVDAGATTITGLHILEQVETPGLGNKIADRGTKDKPGFLWHFLHGRPDARRPLAVTTAKPARHLRNRVRSVTGATISSRSVCDIVNEALQSPLRAELAKRARRFNAAAASRPATSRSARRN